VEKPEGSVDGSVGGGEGGEGPKEPGGKTRLIPNAVHLVRRGDYLCGLIREYTELSKAYTEQQAQYGPGRLLPPSSSSNRQPEASSSKRIKIVTNSNTAPAEDGSGAGGSKVKRKSTPVYTDSSSDSD